MRAARVRSMLLLRPALASAAGLAVFAVATSVADTFFGNRMLLSEWAFGSRRQLLALLLYDGARVIAFVGIPCLLLSALVFRLRSTTGSQPAALLAGGIMVLLALALWVIGLPAFSVLLLVLPLALALALTLW